MESPDSYNLVFSQELATKYTTKLVASKINIKALINKLLSVGFYNLAFYLKYLVASLTMHFDGPIKGNL